MTFIVFALFLTFLSTFSFYRLKMSTFKRNSEWTDEFANVLKLLTQRTENFIVLSSNTSSRVMKFLNEIWRNENRKSSNVCRLLVIPSTPLNLRIVTRKSCRGRDNFFSGEKNELFDVVINSFLNDKHCPFHTKSRWTWEPLSKQIDRQKSLPFLRLTRHFRKLTKTWQKK